MSQVSFYSNRSSVPGSISFDSSGGVYVSGNEAASLVSANANYSTGTNIGSVTVNGDSTKFYVPQLSALSGAISNTQLPETIGTTDHNGEFLSLSVSVDFTADNGTFFTNVTAPKFNGNLHGNVYGANTEASSVYYFKADNNNGAFSAHHGQFTQDLRVYEKLTCGSLDNGGGGYCEMFEWLDGNPDNEDRRGYFVTLENEKIRIATPEDKFILGAIDPTPSVINDVAPYNWTNKYQKDIFGTIIYEDVEVTKVDPETEEETIVVEKQPILNPDWNDTLEYIPRTERPEWAAITSKGKIVLIDDGTCKVNSFATVGKGGIATYSDTNISVRVLKRIDDTHIKVYIDSVFINS